MANKTGTVLSSMLGLRMEDPGETRFTSVAKLDAINLGQEMVINVLHNAFLDSLQVEDTAVTIASEKIRISNAGAAADLSFLPIRGGILSVYSEANSLWCTLMETRDIRRLGNSYLASSTTNPVAYVFGEYLYVENLTGDLTVWFLRVPLLFAVATIASSCTLEDSLADLVLDFAEAVLWRAGGKPKRGSEVYKTAFETVARLNARYREEMHRGQGTFTARDVALARRIMEE